MDSASETNSFRRFFGFEAGMVCGAALATVALLNLMPRLPIEPRVASAHAEQTSNDPAQVDVLNYLDGKRLELPVGEGQREITIRKANVTDLEYKGGGRVETVPEQPWRCRYKFLYRDQTGLYAAEVVVLARDFKSRRVYEGLELSHLARVEHVASRIP